MTAERAALWLWGGWYVTWWIPALWSARPAARPKRSGAQGDRLLSGVGALLLFLTPARSGAPLLGRVWTEPAATAWGLVAVVVAAFAFCWWARVHLGRLWSGLVTVKADHRIVDTGPYRLVRHPIYTGVILAAAALALIRATPAALLGAALLAAGFSLTAAKEEVFLRESLGREGYDAYARRTPMLVPFAPRRRRQAPASARAAS